MNVEKIMSQPAITCRTDDSLATAAELMWNHDCGVIVVVDTDGAHIAGMVTDRDICMAAYTQGKPLAQIPVTSAMASQVITCRPKDGIDTAEHKMRSQQIRRIAVVDAAGHPVGVLSLNDLARDAVTRKATGVEHDVVQTLAAVCAPRSAATRPAPPAAATRPAKLHATA